MARGSAPGERRGGRKAGVPNRGTALVRDRLDAVGAEPAVELMKIARAAEAGGDLSLAADCWGRLAAFVHPRPRPVEIDPDALIDLERRLVRVKLEEAASVAKDHPEAFGLADRLTRATVGLGEHQALLDAAFARGLAAAVPQAAALPACARMPAHALPAGPKTAPQDAAPTDDDIAPYRRIVL